MKIHKLKITPQEAFASKIRFRHKVCKELVSV
jgi:hypothetical protein